MSTAPAAAPLVSLIVRTLRGETLVRALDSIAAQTHRPIEIVLVDSAGRGVAMSKHRGVPVRLVRGNGFKSTEAANAGLEVAQGAWIGILDDGDEIAPDHIASLLAAAQAGGARAAYAQTQLLGADGQPEHVGGGPFSRAGLLDSNDLAIHAVLFHRSFVDAGCRFDTTLPIFEDWDYWLRISREGDFAFTGRATALQRESSGAPGADLDRELAMKVREVLIKRWS